VHLLISRRKIKKLVGTATHNLIKISASLS